MNKNELEAALHQWQQFGQDAASKLEEIGNARVSQTMTEHRAAEIMAENNRSILAVAARIRELLGA